MKYTKRDIIGLSEIRRRGENQITLESGHLFHYKGGENSSVGGAGFIVKKKIISQIIQIVSMSARVIYLIIRINYRYNLKVVQVYASTTEHSDKDVENVYDHVKEAFKRNPTTYSLITDDFNSKLGKKRTKAKFRSETTDIEKETKEAGDY